MLTKKEKIK